MLMRGLENGTYKKELKTLELLILEKKGNLITVLQGLKVYNICNGYQLFFPSIRKNKRPSSHTA